jgi:hypothetical protein
MAVRCLALNTDMERARSSLSPVCFLDNEIGDLLFVSRGAYFSMVQNVLRGRTERDFVQIARRFDLSRTLAEGK